MTSTKAKLEFVHAMARNTRATVRQCEALMRYAGTHRRIETELTNGYKDKVGEWDQEQTERAKIKRERIDKRMEAIAAELDIRIVYGALTVSVRMDDREVYIP